MSSASCRREVTALDLPRPPDQLHGAPPRRAKNSLIVLIVVVLAGVCICVCGGLVGLVGMAFDRTAERSQTRSIDPWLDAIRAGDFESAANMAGEGVSGEDIEGAFDREIGLPLAGYEAQAVPPVKVSVNSLDHSQTHEIAYELVGSRSTRTVWVRVEWPDYSGAQMIAVPEWGLEPIGPTEYDEPDGPRGPDEYDDGYDPWTEPGEDTPQKQTPGDDGGGGLMLPPADE